MKKFLNILILVVLLDNCSTNKTQVFVDNPLNETIKVMVDGNAPISLNPSEYLPLSLEEGKHSFSSFYQNGSLLNKGNFNLGEQEMLLNVSRNDYVLWKIVFSEQSVTGNAYPNIITDDTFDIKGKKYWGPFVHYPERQILIPKDWDIDVLTPAPDKVTIEAGKPYTLIKKLYREEDFIAEYSRFYEQNPEKIQEYFDKLLQDSVISE